MPTNKETTGATTQNEAEQSGLESLRANAMMAHLIDALEAEQDIGHYGRLVFAMIARHFLKEEELLTLLCKNPNLHENQVRVFLRQVESRDYNPPRPERIREWQTQQDFPICPDSEDPDGCNVYRDLKFPEHIYDNIQQYQEKKAELENEAA